MYFTEIYGNINYETVHVTRTLRTRFLTLPAQWRILSYTPLVQTHLVYSTVNLAHWDSMTFPINPQFIFPRIFIDKVFRKPQKFDNKDTHMQQMTVVSRISEVQTAGDARTVYSLLASQLDSRALGWCCMMSNTTPTIMMLHILMQRSWCCDHDVA